jgi:hypothetical protein
VIVEFDVMHGAERLRDLLRAVVAAGVQQHDDMIHQAGKPFQERPDAIGGVPRANGAGHDGFTLAHRAFKAKRRHPRQRSSFDVRGPAAFDARSSA